MTYGNVWIKGILGNWLDWLLLWHVTGVSAKLTTCNIRVKLKRTKSKNAELETRNATIRPCSKNLKRPKTYLNLLLRHHKHFQNFLERFVNLMLPIALFSFVRKSRISAKLNIKLDELLFIKRCDASNFEFFINFFFDYFGYCQILNTFFPIF